MDPISIIGGGICFGIVLLGILFLVPKAREYNEQVAREQSKIQSLVQAQGWRISKPEKGDIKWIIHTQAWQLHYDSDSSSDSSTPFLQWIALTPANSKARFVVLTEHGLKMMKHPFTRKAVEKLQGFANKIGQKNSKLPIEPNRPDPTEVFQIIDAQNEYQIGQTKKQKLMLAASSHETLHRIKGSDIPCLLSKVMEHEKSYTSDNTERLAQFNARIEIKIYTNRPTSEFISDIVALGEAVLALKI